MVSRLIPFVALVLLGGCAENRPEGGAASSGPGDAFAPADGADGWAEIVVTAGFADTKISPSGHFAITRNACFVDGSGALPLEAWNALARAANAAATAPAGTEAESTCFPAGTGRWTMDGSVTLKLARGGERLALEARGSDVCSTLKDRSAAQALLDAVNRILPDAFTEDCVQ